MFVERRSLYTAYVRVPENVESTFLEGPNDLISLDLLPLDQNPLDLILLDINGASLLICPVQHSRYSEMHEFVMLSCQ